MSLPRLVPDSAKKPLSDNKKLFTLSYSLGPNLYATGLTVDELIKKIRATTKPDSHGFMSMFLTHVVEHLEASKAAGKLQGTDLAPTRFDNITYYGHGSCPPDSCLCVYGDNQWCEDC